MIVWGIAILIGAILAFAAAATVSPRPVPATPTAATAEPLLAFELDRLFRSDRTAAQVGNDTELRAQAARILTSGLGHAGMAPEDHAYLVRLVEARTGLPQPEAEARVQRAIDQAAKAIKRARTSAVILAFMTAASLMSELPQHGWGQPRVVNIAMGQSTTYFGGAVRWIEGFSFNRSQGPYAVGLGIFLPLAHPTERAPARRGDRS